MAKGKNTKVTRASARKKSTFRARNSREKKMAIGIIVLAIALIGTIGVAVASFSTDLDIRGTATVKSTIWDIHFDNLRPVALAGNKTKEVTKPTIQNSVSGTKSTVIKDYEIELKDPGDAAEYTFDVVNAGELDAEITAIVMSSDITTTPKEITCVTSYADNDPDKGVETAAKKKAREDAVCDNINYTLKYTDGTDVAVGDTLDKANNGIDTTRTMKLKLELDPNTPVASLPDKDVKITGLGITITYGQRI